MILDRTPLNLNEVQELLKNIEGSEKREEIEVYLKKFLKTKPTQAKKIKEELETLDLIKLKREHIVKIIDTLPQDVTDFNKVFTDVSLTEDETNKILEIVKNSK